MKPNESKQYRVLRLESLQKFPNSFGSTYADQKQKAKLAFENYIEIEHPENFIIGAFQAGELMGICGFYRHKDERSNHRGEIIQMYVQAKYQGRQIGFHLLKTALVAAFQIEGLEQIDLGVFSSIKAANRLYEKMGFQDCGLQRNFFKINGTYFDQRLMVLVREAFV